LHNQIRLLSKGVFVRGGVTLGFTYHNQAFTFGPGIIDAYLIESKRAVYPRIVVERQLLDVFGNVPALHSELHTPEQEGEYVRSLLCQCGDDEWFIDYLRAAEGESNSPEQYLEFIQLHRDLVVREFDLHCEDDHIADKYRWLARYHDEVVSGFSDEALEEVFSSKGVLLIGIDRVNYADASGSA
jgi:hypothetical protein